MGRDFHLVVEEICERDTRYRMDAYAFIMEALAYTQKRFKAVRHVSGDEMLQGVRELLLDRFGPMTMTVLNYWGIKSTEDFGNIVFNLVENSVLTKTDNDSLENFRNAYDFEEVFNQGYRKQLAKKISRMRSM